MIASLIKVVYAGIGMNKPKQPFWETKRLDEMSQEEWESLCDGCARCCMHKLEDEDNGNVYYTRIACRLLDIGSCRCTDYANRRTEVPDCLVLTPNRAQEYDWLPETCAYRKLSRGEKLEAWHPLISGDPESVHRAGISVRQYAVQDDGINEADYEDYLVDDSI